MFEHGKMWGRMARLAVELREHDPQTFQLLNRNRWVKNISNKNGKFEFEYAEGVFSRVLHHMEDVMGRPANLQIDFWHSFSTSFGKKITFRRQDAKAIRIYLLLLISWPQVQEHTSIRELYDFVFKRIPKEPCLDGADPVDFEERQFKWFEKLCHRNIGLSLAKRGRPTRSQ